MAAPKRKIAVANTLALLGVALLVAVALGALITLAYGYCVTDCNQTLMDIGYGVPAAALWIVFGATGVVTVITLRMAKTAWFFLLIVDEHGCTRIASCGRARRVPYLSATLEGRVTRSG